MPSVQQLREQRSQAATRITELANRINTERRDFKPDEQANWDTANAEYDRLGREIQTAERAEQVERERNGRTGDRVVGREDTSDRRRRRGTRDNVQPTEGQRNLCFRAWARRQMGMGLTDQQRAACRALKFRPSEPELRIGLWPDAHMRDVQHELRRADNERRSAIFRRETRANLSAQIPTSGGYLVAPGTLSAAFEMNLLAFGGALQVADVITTQSGEPYFAPTVDDTTNTGALMGENTQAFSTGVNPSFGMKRLDAYKFTSTPVLIPTELLEDDQYDLSGHLGEMLGIRLGRGQAPYFATGDGASRPEGIVTGSELGITTASATAITFDELVRLEHSIDPAYRTMPGVGWLMHDQVKSYIRRIKDGNGRPLWVSG